jgi:hypothetical protein
VGPSFARGGGDPDEVGDLLGHAELYGVALTPTPQQSESIIDPVRLSRGASQDAATAAQEVVMDPEKTPDTGDMAAEVAALKEGLGELRRSVDDLREMVKAKADDDDEGEGMALSAEPGDVASPAEVALSRQVDAAWSALTPDERKTVDKATGAHRQAFAAVGKPERVEALAAKLQAIGAVQAERVRHELSARVDALQAEAIEAKVERERERVRGLGASAATAERIAGYFAAKLRNPQQWAAMVGSACPYEGELARLAASPDVPQGRKGVTAQPVNRPHTFESAKAWATEHKVELRGTALAQAYAKAHHIQPEELF